MKISLVKALDSDVFGTVHYVPQFLRGHGGKVLSIVWLKWELVFDFTRTGH